MSRPRSRHAASVAAALLAAPLAALLLAAGPVRAQSAGEWRGPAHLWHALCGYCHGAGVGLQLLGAHRPAELIATITRSGLRAMPAFAPTQISDEELTALAEWISRSEAPPPAAAREGGR